MRFWYWVLPIAGVALVALIVYTLVAFAADGRIFSFAFLVNGVLVFPAMVISLAIDQFVLLRRRPIGPTRAERVLISVLVLILAVLVVTSLSEDTSFITVFGWPVLIVAAISTTAVLGVTSARVAREAASSADDGDLEDLFPGGEN